MNEGLNVLDMLCEPADFVTRCFEYSFELLPTELLCAALTREDVRRKIEHERCLFWVDELPRLHEVMALSGLEVDVSTTRPGKSVRVERIREVA